MSTSQAPPSSGALTQLEVMQLKKEEQRAKTRARMARYRQRLKELPLEEQVVVHEKARIARARYRDNHRAELRANARCIRTNQYAAKYGAEAYAAKVERKREKQIEESEKRRRNVRLRVPKPKSPMKKGSTRRPTPQGFS